MLRILAGIVLLLFVSDLAQSQIWPKEGAHLNYRLIGFSLPEEKGNKDYKIEIAIGHCTSFDSFQKNIIKHIESKSNRVIVEVPSFGKEYTWRMIDKATKNELHHFSTGVNEHVDSTKLRLRILQQADEKYENDYVAVDGGGVLYDMKGQPVWYIPDTNGFGGNVADIKFTPQGTLTFICKKGYEIDYNANVVWSTPDKNVIGADTFYHELYHHEFVKLANGHYMVLGMQLLKCKLISSKDSDYIVVTKDTSRILQNGFREALFGQLLEYDQSGRVVWSWRSSDYLLNADLAYFHPTDTMKALDAHDNAFYVDEQHGCIYVGYKNMSRIVKIGYPGGKILNTYGAMFKPGEQSIGVGLFCGQHSIARTKDGLLLCFNNNACKDNAPTIVMLKEPVGHSGELKKVWEYECVPKGAYKKSFAMGGNVKELMDNSLFINMGSKYSELLIVDRSKKELWSGLPERYIQTEQRWVPIYEYRANIINREELEKLIWNSETL